MKTIVFTVLFTFIFLSSWNSCIHSAGLGPRSEYIKHYEGLQYDTDSLNENHDRVRRSATFTSADQDSEVRLSFRALDRHFQLRLRRDTSTFASKPEIIQADGSVQPLDISHIYQGELEDESDSYVHGSIIHGIFAGRIDLSSGTTYYVDKTEVHFSSASHRMRYPFHSIIYAEHDVIKEPDIRPEPSAFVNPSKTESGGCAMSSSDVFKWMGTVQKSAINTPQEKMIIPEINSDEPIDWKNAGHQFYNSYVWPHTDQSQEGRRRRDTSSSPNRVCSLFLQSDPMMWNYMTNGTKPTGVNYGLGYSPARARDEITALFASHVDGMKKIYQQTVFQLGSLGPFTGITFVVYRIQINTSYGCGSPKTDNPFCQSNIDVSNFLNLNSLSNQDLYCSAFIFTYRDFSGTLGLAWVASSTGSAGGICDKWKQYSDGNGGIVYKSLNTGIISLLNYGTTVPTVVSTLTFAHEIGHNFGSPHDIDPFCAPTLNNPNDPNGNYIMFASATPGTFPNNHHFSTCSIGNMTQVINGVLTGAFSKVNCFIESGEAFCGNRIQEGNEQCDCGFESDCQSPVNPDNCCYPEESPFKCQLKPNMSCSASEGPCCNGPQCSFLSASSNVMCFTETECSYSAFCNGLSAKCPVPTYKTNLTMCNSNTQVCKSGSCTGSVCETIGWTSCSIDTSTTDLSLFCFVACYNHVTGQCVSTNSESDVSNSKNSLLYNLLTNLTLQQSGIRLPAGMPCNNYQGYCDVFQKCRAVNEEGPLARLQNVFNSQTANEIRNWITTNWWAILLMVIGLVILMGLFIKVCAVHTPSSNPNQKAARKLTLPRRHAHRTEGGPRSVAVVNSVVGSPPHIEGAKQTADRPATRSHRHKHRPKSTGAAASEGNRSANSNFELESYPHQAS